MPQLILEIEDERDTRLFVELAERLNVRLKKGALSDDKNVISEEDRQKRMEVFGQFRGKLKKQEVYEPLKSEFYEQ